MRHAVVSPLLKKSSFDANNLKNVHPVSNWTYMSKLLERAVAKHLQSHLSSHSLHGDMQFAYRAYHSMETALCVQNNILVSMDQGNVMVLVLLDLSSV